MSRCRLYYPILGAVQSNPLYFGTQPHFAYIVVISCLRMCQAANAIWIRITANPSQGKSTARSVIRFNLLLYFSSYFLGFFILSIYFANSAKQQGANLQQTKQLRIETINKKESYNISYSHESFAWKVLFSNVF